MTCPELGDQLESITIGQRIILSTFYLNRYVRTIRLHVCICHLRCVTITLCASTYVFTAHENVTGVYPLNSQFMK
jgi:hypothetical protein